MNIVSAGASIAGVVRPVKGNSSLPLACASSRSFCWIAVLPTIDTMVLGLMSHTVLEAWEWAVQAICWGISARAAKPSDLKYFDHRLSVSACGTPGF